MTNMHLSLNTVCRVYHLLYKKKKVKHSSLQKAKDYYAYWKISANENGKASQVKKSIYKVWFLLGTPFPLRGLSECLKIILLWLQPPSSTMFLQISHSNFPAMCHKRVNYKWNSLHCMKKLLTHFSNTFSVWIQMLSSPIDLYNVLSPQTHQGLKHIIKCFSLLWILFTEVIIILTR